MKYITITVVILSTLFLSLPLEAKEIKPAVMGEKVESFTVWSSTRQRHKLKKHKGSIVVFEWIHPNCDATIEMYNSGVIQEIQQLFVMRSDVVWASVVSAKKGSKGYYSHEALWNSTRDMKAYPGAVLLDDKLRAASTFEITSFPAYVIIDQEQRLVYKGALTSSDGKQNYVTDAIEKLLTGNPVEISESPIEPLCKISK